MAAWRRRFVALFPELRHDLAEDEPLSPYLAFFALLPFVWDAHRRGDEDALRRAWRVDVDMRRQGAMRQGPSPRPIPQPPLPSRS